MVSSEFTVKKLKRKIKSDGVKQSFISAGDLITRKKLGRPVFDWLVRIGIIKTIPRGNLESKSDETLHISYQSEPYFVSVINCGVVLSETGLVLSDQSEIIEESAAEPTQAMQAMMAMLSRELFFGQFPLKALVRKTAPEAAGSLGTAAPLIPRYPNYYHWMVETVPKIRYLRRFEESTGESVTLVIPQDSPPFVGETLQALDWPESRIERATEPAYAVENLVVPSFPQRRAADFEWIRRRILGESATSPEADANNVYISRAGAVERQVLNEDAVMEMLSDHGFERYRLEDRPLMRNARLFSEADIVVAPHGAGITDIVFSTDCTVIELFGDKVKQPYEILASVLDLDYRAVYCEAESADIRVDVDELEKVVAAVEREDQ
ncbi:glycosyltransferase family 61 protein [Haloarchaeobius iranensis]|nr:glycosyltransferase family 61 protein [Haloarchaeobius iranensis]